MVNHLQLDNVSYTFPAAPGSDAFRLGPVNLNIEQGDIIFIVGENGCGKTIIVISHDDRYFDMADQLVRMESGRVVTERATA